MALFPTPTATRYWSTNNGQREDGTTFATKGSPSLDKLAALAGGSLNPDWVEALMGFPVGWTKDTTRQIDLFPEGGRPGED